MSPTKTTQVQPSQKDSLVKDLVMFTRLLVAICLAIPLSIPANAATVRPLVLDEIIDTSATAFHGICLENRTERDTATNMIVTYTTFEVRDSIKGAAKSTHVIKQIGGILPGGQEGFSVQGVPRFKVGQEYVVFLAGVSSAGFSSPIGLSQGRFTVIENAGRKTVSNGRDFREMALRPSLTPSVSPDGIASELGLEEFKQMARDRVNGAK